MKRFKFYVPGLIILSYVLLSSCKDWEDNELKGVLPITIEEMLVPETGAAGQSVEINVYAEAPNGCFRDLKVTLLRLNSQHYLFRATGYYDSNDACPAVVSSIDTLIVFEPPSAGEFYFQANEDPLPILRDTVTVM